MYTIDEDQINVEKQSSDEEQNSAEEQSSDAEQNAYDDHKHDEIISDNENGSVHSDYYDSNKNTVYFTVKLKQKQHQS